MKSATRKLFYAFGVLSLAGVLSIVLGANTRLRAGGSDESDGFGGHSLNGTWYVKVNLSDCQTGALIGNPFYSYLAFAGNGTMSENTENPGFAVGQRSSGLGIWNRAGWRVYNAKSVAFIFFTTPPAPPMNPGFTAGTQTIAQQIRLEGPDQFSSKATIAFADSTGAVYRNGCAVATATRFK
jgi:hypothetical protein